MKTIRLSLAAALLAAATSVNAHYLWIEKAGGNTLLRFGEFAENARERSPGRLDEIPNPQAQTAAAKPIPMKLQRGADGFVFPADAKGDLVAEEKNFAVKDWSKAGIGIVKPMFYARAAIAATASPLLTLDIVPAGTGKYQLWFQGKPLANHAVTIYAPNGWWQEHKSDAEGKVKLAQPWRGQYVIETILLEKTAGEFEGKRYEAIRHRATLTVQQANGAETFAISN